ncbi:MAG: tRNA uridine-5-carboxymethylaminomethyl(34) synthesis GTPase MnmE [Nitrospinota bacterium]
MNLEDTITAIATPIGEGGIGMIRISGDDSLEIANGIFKPHGKKAREFESHRLYFGKLHTAHGPIDDVCLVYMKAPRSYTRQDTVEISCHGSPAVLRRALKAAMQSGARMAEPGEFTKRAFLNGRIDLAQAEGVIDLIKARSEGAAKAAFNMMEGGLSSRINAVKEKLVSVTAHLEASIDFPDEELVTATDENIIDHLDKAVRQMERMIESYERGKFLKRGMGLAIIGKPNVGKSSLLNALLEEDHAIVTEHPGTTRDLIRAQAEIMGLAVELIDTAGLNPDPDHVESIGIARALKAAEGADAVIGIFDGSSQWDDADSEVLKTLKKASRYLAVINKSDLPQKLKWPHRVDAAISPLAISAKTHQGLEGLIKKISQLAGDIGKSVTEEPVVTRRRHIEIFSRIVDDLKRAKDELAVGREVAAASVWDALEEIKRFTGESYTDEVLDTIFDEFCIGK